MAWDGPPESLEGSWCIPFGKYKGSRLDSLDEDYLIFLRDNFQGLHKFPVLEKYIEDVVTPNNTFGSDNDD